VETVIGVHSPSQIRGHLIPDLIPVGWVAQQVVGCGSRDTVSDGGEQTSTKGGDFLQHGETLEIKKQKQKTELTYAPHVAIADSLKPPAKPTRRVVMQVSKSTIGGNLP
jgi:hypothetical protein